MRAKVAMALPIWPICPSFEVNGLDWQRCLAGSSKTAPKIFIFSNFLGAEYLSFIKSIATFALTFFRYIISVLASVYRVPQNKMTSIKPWVWWVSGLHKLHFQLFTLISLINVEFGINVEGVQKMGNQKMWRLEYCS